MKKLTLAQLAALVGAAIDLEDDCLLSEIRTAEDLDDAIRRVEAIAEDAAAALIVLRSEKKRQAK